MSGAAGHIFHVWENYDLTFAEIKDIINSASEGKLEKISEKLDGINCVFTWDVLSRELKVARSHGDITRGGMDASSLAQKFAGRGNVEAAFNSAFRVLKDSMSALPLSSAKQIFGSHNNVWYSAEIIYAASPNTINYDSNNVVFHGWPVFEIDDTGVVKQRDDAVGIDVLSKNISSMQKAVSVRDWRVRGPVLLNMKRLSNGAIAQAATSSIDLAMEDAGVADDDTIGDYLISLARRELEHLELGGEVLQGAAERAMGISGAPTQNELKKLIRNKSATAEMVQILRSGPEMQKQFIAPIECAIQKFATEVMRGVSSVLVADSDKEVQRLRSQLTKAIKIIENSGNEEAMAVLNAQLSRLGDIENVSAAMEGIVFFYKSQAYKFTAGFAPLHQILSLFKYGKKGLPKLDLSESIVKRAVVQVINEGGKTFKDVTPIKLETLKAVWPTLENDLSAMGCTKIVPVGSTWKKVIMGDIDLAVEHPAGKDELIRAAIDMLGAENVKKAGGSVISLRYPVSDTEFVQVDLMVGDSAFISWSRFGTSSLRGHSDYSLVKGAVRNVLLNIVNRFAAQREFASELNSELDRVKHVIDFDRGLFKVAQSRRNKAPERPPLKNWRTDKSVLVSSNPDEIAQIMFGRDFNASDLYKFEDVVHAIKISPHFLGVADDILSTFFAEIEEMRHILGEDPDATLEYIRKTIME